PTHRSGRRRAPGGRPPRGSDRQKPCRAAQDQGPGEIPVTGRTRLLGIDHGKARLGLAVSDPERRIASPLANYTCRGTLQDGRYLKKVIEKEDIGQVVIGLPVPLSGREGAEEHGERKLGHWSPT